MQNQSTAGVVIMQVTQPVIPGTEFNEESFPVAQTFSASGVKEVENFYVATLKGEVVGVISDTENNRNIVAALVGNWVSAGYVITQLNRKDLLKKLRPAPVVATKQEASTSGEQAATTESAAAEVKAAEVKVDVAQAPAVKSDPVVEQAPVAQAAQATQATASQAATKAEEQEEDLPEF